MSAGPGYFTSDAYLRTYDRADYRCARFNIDLFAARLVQAARKRGVPMYVHTLWRSPKEQTRLVDQGRSKTPPPTAAHVQGMAADVVHAVHHWELSPHEWRLVAELGKAVARQMEISVIWGGDWTFYDPAHWEIKDWRNKPQYTRRDLERLFPHAVRRCPASIVKMGPKF